MELNSFPNAHSDSQTSGLEPKNRLGRIKTDIGIEGSSALATYDQSVSLLSSPATTLSTVTTHDEKPEKGALFDEVGDVRHPFPRDSITSHHPEDWDGQMMDRIQVNKVNSKPEEANQSASLTSAVTDEPVQRLKERVEELEELLRISKNTIDSLDKLVVRYRTAYDQLSQHVDLPPSVVVENDDDRPRSRKRTRSCSFTLSPGLLISHSEMSQQLYDGVSCHDDETSETYDGREVSLSRKSFSRSSSLASSRRYQGSSTRNDLPRSDEAASGHQSSHESNRIFCNSRTPSPLPEDMEEVSTPPGFEVYNSEEEYDGQLENQSLERAVSVEGDRKHNKYRPTFKSPEAKSGHERREVHDDRVRWSTRRASPARSSWRHWTNPSFQSRHAKSTPKSIGGSDPTLNAPKGPRFQDRPSFRGTGRGHPYPRKRQVSHSSSWVKGRLDHQQRPNGHSLRARSHRDVAEFSTSPHRRDLSDRRNLRSQEPQLLRRLSSRFERQPKKNYEDQFRHVSDRNERRKTAYQLSFPIIKRREEETYSRSELRRERFSERY